MGERALAARRLPPGDCACYRSQWGARDAVLRSVFADQKLDLCTDQWSYHGRMCWAAVIEGLDYLRFEALYDIHGDGIVVSLPVWLGLGPDDPTAPTTGVLVETSSVAEFTRRRVAIRRLKSRLGRAIESGEITLQTARETVRSELIARGWVVPETVDSEPT